mgnify:CR=1 FL=1
MGSRAGSASKVKLNSFDDLFGGAENTAGEQIIHVKLTDLHHFVKGTAAFAALMLHRFVLHGISPCFFTR